MSKSILGVTVAKAVALYKALVVTFKGDVTGTLNTDGSAATTITLNLVKKHDGFTSLKDNHVPVVTVDEAGRITGMVERRIIGSIIQVVNEDIVIAAGTTKTYDLTSLMDGIDVVQGDVSILANILLLDQLPSSPTYNFYINSQAMLTVGQNRHTVKVYNSHNEAVSVKVFISLQSK